MHHQVQNNNIGSNTLSNFNQTNKKIEIYVGSSFQLRKPLSIIKNIDICERSIEFSLPDVLNEKNVRAVLAINKNKLAGIWVFRRFYKKISSNCTYVSPSCRKLGLAKKLWEIGLEKYKPHVVVVDIVSDKGYTLINSIKKDFNIEWDTEEIGARNLRDLRKIKRKRG